MKILNKVFVLLVILTATQPSLAWREVGNGGDYVRSQFLRVGELITNFLRETQEGQSITQDFQLDIEQLFYTLDITKIRVVELELLDNSSSIVDAIGTPGMILLNHDKWLEHFSLDRDIYHLVFHEMLRSAAVNDDNYLISKRIFPFPRERKIKTSLTHLYPLLTGSVKDYLKGQVGFAGNGCEANKDEHFIDFDSEWNILSLSPQKYVVKSSSQSPLGRKSCLLSLPIELPSSYRLEVTQAEISAKFQTQNDGELKLTLEIFDSKQQGLKFVKQETLHPNTQGRALIRSAQVFKSPCGYSGNLRVNSSLQLLSTSPNSSTGELIAEVDRVKFYFNLISCAKN